MYKNYTATKKINLYIIYDYFKNIKYLKINLIKDVQDCYIENNKHYWEI